MLWTVPPSISSCVVRMPSVSIVRSQARVIGDKPSRYTHIIRLSVGLSLCRRDDATPTATDDLLDTAWKQIAANARGYAPPHRASVMSTNWRDPR